MPQLRAPHWSGWAWGAIAVVATFIAITVWWLSRDRGVPFADAASHLYTVVAYHDLLRAGDLGGLLHRSGYYPPATFITGGVSTLIGGLNPSAPVIGENLVYASLLALGCYQTGRLVSGPLAGFLAVVFALGSPLLIEQFHVFMIDAPEAAMVAVAVWLILASRRFAQVGTSAAAGIAVGVGMASKEQFALFVAGVLAVVLLRDRGWRNWRGICAFAGCAIAVAAPWYLVNLSQIGTYASAGLANANLPPRGRPPLLSLSNAGWYLWAVANGLLFAPLFAFAAIGIARAVHLVVREQTKPSRVRPMGNLAPELLGGLFGGWLGITLTPHHDMRYTMPLLVYLAVLGTAWIVPLPRSWRATAASVLALAVLATTLGASFGAGGQARIVLAGHPAVTDTSFGIPPPDQLTLYSDHDFNVSAPRRGDDVLGLFRALRRAGVTGVAWTNREAPVGDPVLDSQGVRLLARFAGLRAPSISRVPTATHSLREPRVEDMSSTTWNLANPRHAFLIRQQSLAGASPCMRLRDGTSIWFTLGDPNARDAQIYCPLA